MTAVRDRVGALGLSVTVALVILGGGPLGSGAAAKSRPGPRPRPPEQLRLTLSRGWIGASIGAPPLAGIVLEERRDGGLRLLLHARVPRSGKVTLPHVAPWLCDRRYRTFVLEVPHDPSAHLVHATTKTPGCSNRLALGAPSRAQVGERLAVAVTDTFGTGDVPYRLCITPPAAAQSCHASLLHTGHRARSVTVDAISPGRWLLTLSTPFRQVIKRRVAVEHRGGRLRLLATGDSEIQEVDADLAAALEPDRVDVTSDAVVGSGISKVRLFDWVHHAAEQVRTIRPDVTVMFIGANDGFSLQEPSGTWVPCCGRGWIQLFAGRTEQMISAYLEAGRGRVVWLTHPIARDPAHAAIDTAVNAAYELAAAHFHSGVVLIRADQVFTPGGHFTQTIVYGGQQVSVRAADGIHLSPAGARIAAALVSAALTSSGLIAAPPVPRAAKTASTR